MLDNWGDLIGLKGSGSHSVVIEDVIVPEHHTITLDEWMSIGVTLDARLSPARQPALRRVVPRRSRSGSSTRCRSAPRRARSTSTSACSRRPTRQVGGRGGAQAGATTPNYQRLLGLALAYTDAAYSILIRCGELYHEYAREAMEGGEPFGAGADASASTGS